MKTLLIFFLISASISSFAQYSAATHTQMHFQTQPRGFMTTLPPAPPGLEGSVYIHDDWNRAEVFMTDSTKLSDINVKINVLENLVEIEYDQETKILPIARILAISLKTSNGDAEEYINGSVLKDIGTFYKNNLLQVIKAGPVMLLCKVQPEIIHATNNPHPMLDVGKKDDEIVLKKIYVILKGQDFATTATGKAKFRDEMIALFGAEVEPLLKKLNLKKEQDLVALVTELNKRHSN